MSDRADFSLTQLRCFVTSAETESISEAAHHLHASQSAVSMAIQRLEKQLGTKLFFRRRTKGVSLTPSGRILFDDAKALLIQAQELQARSREWQGEIQGKLDVAFVHSIAPFVLPTLLSKIRKLHPQLNITVHEGTVDRVLELLHSGTCELAVTGELSRPAPTFTPIAEVSALALISQSDPLTSVGHATLRELSTRPLLTVDGPTGHAESTDMYAKLFTQAGAPMPRMIQASSMSTMLGLVGIGEGFALMHRQANGTTFAVDNAVPVDIVGERPCTTNVGITKLPGLSFSRRAKLFSSLLRDTVRDVCCIVNENYTNGREVA